MKLFDRLIGKDLVDSPKLELPPTWRVAYGKVDPIAADATWRDDRVALFLPDASQMAWSQSERWVVAGDVWLSNRVNLIEKLGFEVDSYRGSDREIVAEVWGRWGVESLDLFLGTFGLVGWDRDRQVLWLVRDAIGARTIYYTNTGSTRWIAPKPRTLAAYRSGDLDLVALRDYLTCAFVPGERTLWQQIRELRPGTILQFPAEKVKVYWQVKERITEANKSLVWHGDRLRTLLDNVVREYLPPANEPVGIFLSGGLDSSSITALAAKIHAAPVHTFSIHFGLDLPHELEFSSLVAARYQTQHHILEITWRDMWQKLAETMAYLDDPIGDPLTVPNLLVGKLARKFVSVVLNGEGGDPCFGGPKNQPMLIHSLYGSVTERDSLTAYLMAFQKCYSDLPQLLKPEIWLAVEKEAWIFAEDLHSQANYLNRLMAINIKFKGADHILTKVNNLTQAAGLEGRSPLFDRQIVELSMEILPEYKLSGVEEKAVLKQAVADLLPQPILTRPKSGMMVPVQLGFRQYWQREAKQLLLNPKAMIADYLNPELIRNWLNYRGDTWERYGVKLWLLASLEMWLNGR